MILFGATGMMGQGVLRECLLSGDGGDGGEGYTRVTCDSILTVARTMLKANPDRTFAYVSDAGTDTSEKGRSMWRTSKDGRKTTC